MNATQSAYSVASGTLLLGLLSFILPGSGCSPKPSDHGVAFVVALDTNQIGVATDQSQLLTRAEETLRKRIKNLGVHPFTERNAEGRLIIKLPQLNSNELATARRVLSKPGILEFRVVHAESDRLVREGITPPEDERLNLIRTKAGPEGASPYLVEKKPELGLTGIHLASAGVQPDPLSNQPEILLRFGSTGAD